jgi:hypothetical protein
MKFCVPPRGCHWLCQCGVAILVALFATGCGGGANLAPVSGQVKLNGRPLPEAHLTFQPTGSGSVNVGVGSYGNTDAEGRYELKTIKGSRGAVVGTHTVSIRTHAHRELPSSVDKDAPGRPKEKIPERYNDNTELTFEVPEDGTDSADFDLKAP